MDAHHLCQFGNLPILSKRKSHRADKGAKGIIVFLISRSLSSFFFPLTVMRILSLLKNSIHGENVQGNKILPDRELMRDFLRLTIKKNTCTNRTRLSLN